MTAQCKENCLEACGVVFMWANWQYDSHGCEDIQNLVSQTGAGAGGWARAGAARGLVKTNGP